MKYIFLYFQIWGGATEGHHRFFDSLEEFKEWLKAVNFQWDPKYQYRMFKLGEEIEIKLNEVPFKGLTSD